MILGAGIDIISRAVSVGFEKAVQEMPRLMKNYLDQAVCLFL
jgi:pyridoxine 5'-phosphate synthase PdxJ